MDRARALRQLRELKKYGKDLRLAAEGWPSTWKCLFATMLSAQTRDTVTIEISRKLFRKYPSVRALANAKITDIQKIIKSVNYYKTKSRNLINLAKALMKEYNGKVPMDVEKLVRLPGIGRKTANVCLSEHGHAAIGIDTHCMQISRELRWTKNTNPNKIEEDLRKLFPKNRWKDVNPIMVKFGQSYRSRKEWKELLSKVKKIK